MCIEVKLCNVTVVFLRHSVLLALHLAISIPRIASSGHELPNARLVSSTVHPDVDSPDLIHTLMLMMFGQFLDHDLSLSPISKIAASARGLFSLGVILMVCCIILFEKLLFTTTEIVSKKA